MTSTLDENIIENLGSDDHQVKKFSFKKFKKFFKFKKKKVGENKEKVSVRKLSVKNEASFIDFPSGYGEYAKFTLISIF